MKIGSVAGSLFDDPEDEFLTAEEDSDEEDVTYMRSTPRTYEASRPGRVDFDLDTDDDEEPRNPDRRVVGRPKRLVTARGVKVLRAISERLKSGPVRLADVNRALGESTDFIGGWSVLRSLRQRRLIDFDGTKPETIRIIDHAAVAAEIAR